MHTNWKRGIIRLYLVLWPIWLVYLLVRVASLPPILWQRNFIPIAVWGLVAPALLFIGVLWVANGFLPDGKPGDEQR